LFNELKLVFLGLFLYVASNVSRDGLHMIGFTIIAAAALTDTEVATHRINQPHSLPPDIK
jgi:hypothetical protein